jgi:pimeloyl-ACP methyl ester carboxylesterase
MSTRPTIAPDRSGYLPLSDGARRVYWEYFGQGDREVAVMLNGVAMSTRGWHRNLPELQPAYDVLLYDYLGQGRSSQEDEPYFIDEFAGYLVRIMDELGIERVHPVGVSYGGFIAAELGRLFGDRLHTLTLSGILLTRETQFQMYQDLSLRPRCARASSTIITARSTAWCV